MFEEKGLTEVRRVEGQLLQKVHESATFDLTNLVAIFTRSDNGPWLPVFNTEESSGLLDFSEALTLKQLLQDKRDLSAEYDGMVITFEALGLVRSDIVTRGPRFYPIEQLYRRLNQERRLPQTQLKLARTLFSAQFARGELGENAPEYATATWLKKVARLFRISLPALLQGHQGEGLLAVVPDENFKHYLDQQQCSLVYVTTPVGSPVTGSITVLDLQQFTDRNIKSEIQLCAAFEEVELFNQGINPRTPGFVNLRKESRQAPYSIEIRNTLKQLALLCHQRSVTERRFVQPARLLALEYELADQELDDLIGIELSPDWTVFSNSSSVCSYYLTLPESESTPEGVASLEDFLTGRIRAESDHYIASLHSLQQLFSTSEDTWHSLGAALLRLDKPQVLARSAHLTSRFLGKRHDVPIETEKIVDEAAIGCYAYSLAEPYYYYWPRGGHEHHMLQSYENFHIQLDALMKNVDDGKRKSFYHSLKIWWNYQERDFKRRERLVEEAVKELEFTILIKQSEGTEQYSATNQLYELFSAILRMFSRTWQPAKSREMLLKAGFAQIARDSAITPWDVLELPLDPKQPSPLFLAKLREFLDLCEESYAIRIEEHDSYLKAGKLIEIGSRLCQHIGLNFYKHMAKYTEFQARPRTDAGEEAYGTEENFYETSIDLGEELDDSLLLPEHERLWMKSLYCSAIGDHVAIIYNLQSKPVRGKVTPVEVTQHVPTVVEISLAAKTREMLEKGTEVEIILSISKDYDIQSRIVRKKFGTEQSVKFTIAFRTTGNVALLFEYIIDKKKHYYDEAWVYVIGLETQVRRVRNPYQYGSEIVSPADYYGRRQDLEKIFDHLWAMVGDRERQNFRLRGMRRSGKTSLLNMIRKAIEEPETRRHYHIPKEMDIALDKWHPVFYSLQRLPDDADVGEHLDSKVFFKSLTKQICKSLRWTDEAIHGILSRIDIDFDELGDIVGAVEAQLEQLLEELGSGERILILLDEVDLIGTEKDVRFFGQLRSIINSAELTHIAWILTSTRALQAPGEGLESPLHNIFAPIILKNLDATEARRLILEPASKENIYFEPEATESILQQTGRQPFLLQVVCSTVVDQLNIEQTSYVSKTFADAVIEKLLQPGTVIDEQCQFLWDRASESSKVILVLFAQHEQGMFKRELMDAFRNNFPPRRFDSNTLFDDAWKELLANDLISRDQEDFCHLTIPIFRRWLKQRDLDPRNPR